MRGDARTARIANAAATLLALACCVAARPVPVAAGADFTSPFVAYEAGRFTTAVAAGDLNGDGRNDLVAANAGVPILAVRLALAGGGFGARLDTPTESAPGDVALGDLDGDGGLDAAALCHDTRTIRILHGGGDGSFSFVVDLETPLDPAKLELADLDGDADLDCVVLAVPFDQLHATLCIWDGDGGGGFGARRDLDPGGASTGFGIGDLDGDGFPEIVVANADPQELRVLHNAGDGTFPTTAPAALAGSPSAVAVGDWNADGRADVAVYHERFELGNLLQRIGIWTATQSGGLEARPELVATGLAIELTTGDLNADTHADLVAVGARVNAYLGRGDGSFGFPRFYDAGNSVFDAVVAPLDADANADVAVAAFESWAVCVLPGNGDGSLGVDPVRTVGLPQAVAVGDLDADGNPDLVCAGQGPNGLGINRGRGDGTFSPVTLLPVEAPPFSVAIGDLNGDSIPDLACATDDTARGELIVFLGLGAGSFGAANAVPLAGPATWVVLGDWNGDAKLDAAVALLNTPWPNDAAVSILLGRGDGSFETERLQAVGPLPLGLTSGDFDADGHADLIASFRRAATDLDGGVSLLRGAGDGTFARTDRLTGFEPRGVALGDLDEDGTADLIVVHSFFARQDPGNVGVLRGLGAGNFADPVTALAGIEPYGIVVADFDRDRHLDVAVANATSHSVSVWRGTGTGGLRDRQDFGTGPHPKSLATADLDRDRRPDLVTANSIDATASPLLDRIVPVEIDVTDLAAAAGNPGVCLTWQLAPDALDAARGVQIERAAVSEAGPWEVRTAAPLAPERRGRFCDAAAAASLKAWYRLVLLDASGTRLSFGPVVYEPTSSPRFALHAPIVPRDGPISFVVELDKAAVEAQLEIHDVRGRRIDVQRVAADGAGTQVIRWDRRDAHGRRVARGAYWVELVAPPRRAVRRLLLVHD